MMFYNIIPNYEVNEVIFIPPLINYNQYNIIKNTPFPINISINDWLISQLMWQRELVDDNIITYELLDIFRKILKTENVSTLLKYNVRGIPIIYETYSDAFKNILHWTNDSIIKLKYSFNQLKYNINNDYREWLKNNFLKQLSITE